MLIMISFGSNFMDSHGLHYRNTFNGKHNSGVVGCCVLVNLYSAKWVIIRVVVLI
jgi:hypothetical protein